MNLAPAIYCADGERITERHVDATQFDTLTPGQQEFSKRVPPRDCGSEQAACCLQQTLTDGNGSDD